MTEETSHLDVLLVEDNPGDAKLVEHHLDSPSVSRFVNEMTLSHVETLEEAVEHTRSQSFDVVLLDLGLQLSSGLETLDRANERLEEIPIIVLTGMDDREAAIAAVERGAQDYLPKDDLDGDRLVRSLRYAVVRSRQQRELHRKNEQMEFFNSILRHDLLNGMNVIQSRGELLEEQLDGEQAEYAETIVDWSENVTDLTRKVRSTLTTLTDGESTDLEPVELRPVLAAEIERADQMAERVSFSLDCPDDPRILADDLFGDVVGNVLTNAIEHTDGPVEVSVTVTSEQDALRIAIADDGPGIDPADRETLFERGKRSGSSGGTGFGLYFVDKMVDSYGGDIWVDESASGGARFVLELPEPPARPQDSH